MKRRTSLWAMVLVVVLGAALGIAGGSFLAWWLPMAKTFHMNFADLFRAGLGGKRYVSVLMIGEDDSSKRNASGNGLSDTMVVMAMDTETKAVRALSIPRDTMVEIPGHGVCKINSANVYGGPQLSRQVVDDLLGVDIDYYVKINTTGLRGLVDLVGGVYIVVDENMHYTDKHGGLFIDLHAGPQKQLLNGRQAEGYVRFRHDAFGDSGFRIVDGKKVPTGRIVRQQYFIRALANRVLALPTKRERANVLQTAYDRKYIVSDLKMRDWDGLADFFKDIRPEKMAMAVLPGEPRCVHRASYWVPDLAKIPQVVATHLLFRGNPNGEIAKVEVLNGCGVAGVATAVADRLKKAGFQVTRTDNATSFDYQGCCIISHKGQPEPVQRIARLLNCSDIREDGTAKDGIDVTVIVGRNHSE